MDIAKLVFIDETWVSTNMTRRYGRAARGQRCVASVPLSHWETTTFVAALRYQQLTAPMLTDGLMDGEIFLAYLRSLLCPTLTPGDLVIVDNLSSHKVAGVQEAITATGASLLYLPPYSPDLNPSRSSSPSSKLCSVKPLPALAMPSGMSSANYSPASRPRSAPTILPLPVMYIQMKCNCDRQSSSGGRSAQNAA